jgi:hypothetical protein
MVKHQKLVHTVDVQPLIAASVPPTVLPPAIATPPLAIAPPPLAIASASATNSWGNSDDDDLLAEALDDFENQGKKYTLLFETLKY